ncbi:MAG: hypothetical protein WD768_17820 [Phycisphaeraceae bacterium]
MTAFSPLQAIVRSLGIITILIAATLHSLGHDSPPGANPADQASASCTSLIADPNPACMPAIADETPHLTFAWRSLERCDGTLAGSDIALRKPCFPGDRNFSPTHRDPVGALRHQHIDIPPPILL